jgi:hypothetical protein
VDVGVDGNNYKPYSMDNINSIMAFKPMMPNDLPFQDHHDLREEDL